ncbi:uncharacterized protein VTP21DRAFT_2958 [Calcarisporiella thermophila]|uniref:uncharacterized protein n=1 Tax=Calcarisporiella thermophila TaxID=911321 RepID=UPI00374466F5
MAAKKKSNGPAPASIQKKSSGPKVTKKTTATDRSEKIARVDGRKRVNNNDAAAPPKAKRARVAAPPAAKPALNPSPKLPADEGTIFVFGNGDCGQLGLGDERLEVKAAFPVKDVTGVDIVAGGLHSLVLTKDGKIISWGCNDKCVLGRDGDEFLPDPVEGLDGVKIVKIAAADNLSIALTDDGKVYAWGIFRDSEGKDIGFNKDIKIAKRPTLLKGLDKIVDVTAGLEHALALTASGHVYGWGNGQLNQFGHRISERRIKEYLSPQKLPLRDIIHIGSGSYHSFAVTKEGRLLVWGLNNFYQCGLTEERDGVPEGAVMNPTEIKGELEGKVVKQAAGGEHHSVVLLDNGEVYSFGRGDSSQLGLPTELLQKLNENDTEGSSKQAVSSPTRIPGLPPCDAIAVGTHHSLALTREGEVYSWGFGENGALGTGKEEDEITPQKIVGKRLEGYKVIRVSAGAQHSIVLARKL